MFLMKYKDWGFCSSVSQVSFEIKDSPNLWSTWRSEFSEILQVHHQCQEGNELYLPRRMPSGWLDLVSLYRVGVALNSQLEAALSQQHRDFFRNPWSEENFLLYTYCCEFAFLHPGIGTLGSYTFGRTKNSDG